MMDQWLQKAKPGDKGLTRPPDSACVSEHKNEIRSVARGFFQIQFRVPAYKHVDRPTHDSQKREDTLEKVTNVCYTGGVVMSNWPGMWGQEWVIEASFRLRIMDYSPNRFLSLWVVLFLTWRNAYIHMLWFFLNILNIFCKSIEHIFWDLFENPSIFDFFFLFVFSFSLISVWFSFVLKLLEYSYVLELLVGCVNGTQLHVLGSKSDSLRWTLVGSFSSGLSASPIS